MKRQYVKSSVILTIGYDPESQIMEVKFINKDVYQYYNVPPEEYEALMGAKSIGEYFNTVIKPKNYRYKQIDQSP